MKKILVSAALMTAMVSNTFAADLEKIEVVNNGTLEIGTTYDVSLPYGEVESDLKVLKDYIVSFAYKDPQDSKKIYLNLVFDLEKNKDYTIIWVDGAEANMTFRTNDSLVWEYLNNENSSGLRIEKVSVVDSQTVEIYYNEDLEGEEFIFKFLSELPVKSMTSEKEGVLNVSLNSPLEDLTPYIILSTFLKDDSGRDVRLDESFYEFETKDKLINIFDSEAEVLNVASEKVEEEGNLVAVAENAKTTPQTGPATIIVILLTLLAAGLLTRKKA